MRYRLFTLIGILALLSVTCSQNGLSAIAQDAASQSKSDAALSRRAKLLNQLKTLLEPLGVSVTEDALIDISKVKDVNELAIKWEAYPDDSGALLSAEKVKDLPVGKKMRLVKKEKRRDGLAERFGFQLTPEQLFIAGVGADSQLKWWTIIRDPRIVQADFLGANGELTGGTYYRPSPEILISIPDTETITELWVLQPRWAGEQYTLELLTKFPLNSSD